MSKDEYLITDAPLKALTVFAMPMILGLSLIHISSRKYRGKIGKVIKNYAKDLEENLKNAIPDLSLIHIFRYKDRE